MDRIYRVKSNNGEITYFRNKANARNYARTISQRDGVSAKVQGRHNLLGKKVHYGDEIEWFDIKYPPNSEKDYHECEDRDAYIEQIIRLKGLLRHRARRNLAEHLINKSGPIKRSETIDGMDPEQFTEEYLISHLLSFLGFRSRIHHGGKGNGDILLKFDDKCVVVECKPLDVYQFDDHALQTARYHEANLEDNCLGCIITDGVRWRLTMSVDGKLIGSEVTDIREMMKYVLSKKTSKEDAELYWPQAKELIDIFSRDNIEQSFENLTKRSEKILG